MKTSYKASNYWRYAFQSALAVVMLLATIVTNADVLTDPAEKVVIQISTGDKVTKNIVLNNAINVQKELGMDNVVIEIVAYGPGLQLVTADSPFRDRVESMVSQNIRFSACENTIAAIERKTGSKPELASGVETTPSGVVRIMTLQDQGYAYVRP